jgi:hypothetical protein
VRPTPNAAPINSGRARLHDRAKRNHIDHIKLPLGSENLGLLQIRGWQARIR